MHFLKAALLGSAFAALVGSAHATTFNFSYSFDPANTGNGEAVTITGTFDGVAVGDLISSITNASLFVNGTAFSGPLTIGGFNSSTGEVSSNAVISADLGKSNFIFTDSTSSPNNLFWVADGSAFAVKYDLLDANNNGTIGFEDATSAHWTVTAAAVPEPATYLLMAGGLAAVGFVSRRRRQA